MISLAILAMVAVLFQVSFGPKPTKQKLEVANKLMKLQSPTFQPNEFIPSKYTCDGGNVNPPLQFSGVPDSAQSLTLIVDDPDAPAGTWVHWIIFGIDPKIKEIKENSLPEKAVQGMTSFGRIGYGGPCPPSGTHRYFFKLYALDQDLNFDDTPTKDALERAMAGHILDSAELIGLYQRK